MGQRRRRINAVLDETQADVRWGLLIVGLRPTIQLRGAVCETARMNRAELPIILYRCPLI